MNEAINFIDDFLALWQSGGILMWPLLIVAIYIYWIIFDMFNRLSKSNLQALALQSDNLVEDIIGDKPELSLMRTRLSSVKSEHLPFIDGKLKFLGILIGVSPLLGLLGTVMGMLTTFSQMNNSDVQTIDLMAGGISEALITTQMGLVIAVPALIMMMALSTRRNQLNQFFQKVESACQLRILNVPKLKVAT